MREISNGTSAATFNGFVYVFDSETGTYSRFSVDDSYELHEEGKVSFANLGATGTVMTSFVSPSRAYSMTRNNMQIVVWDPTAMEVLGSIATDAAIDPEYPELDYGEPAVFGHYVAWPILWYDYDRLRFKQEVGVVLASTTSDAPAVVVRDSRCGGGWTLFTDDAGDLYVTGNAWFGFAHFFGGEAASYPSDCLLRIRAGATRFDPDFYVDLNRTASTPAVYHTWQAAEGELLAAVWDPQDDPSALPDPDAYWTAPLLRSLVRIGPESSVPVTGIPKSQVWSTLNYRLDDQVYMLVNEGDITPGGGGRSVLYRIEGSVATPALSATGDIWSIGRVR
jgi:hypothetical protein